MRRVYHENIAPSLGEKCRPHERSVADTHGGGHEKVAVFVHIVTRLAGENPFKVGKYVEADDLPAPIKKREKFFLVASHFFIRRGN